jgi:tetratricopeptide (TPR) repeat protein
MKIKNLLIGALLVSASLAPSALARDSADEADGSEAHPVSSMQAFSGSAHQTADGILIGADYTSKDGNYDKAIALLRQAIKKDNDDLDIHLSLAEALENKLKAQDERDQSLFNECVKEWLIVLRNEKGAESGLTFHGLGFMGARYEDDLHAGLARVHLKDLTGSEPRGWETDARYIKRVCKPANTDVSGKIVGSDRNKTH